MMSLRTAYYLLRYFGPMDNKKYLCVYIMNTCLQVKINISQSNGQAIN